MLIDGERVSSGRVREALVAGDPGSATRMLTRAYSRSKAWSSAATGGAAPSSTARRRTSGSATISGRPTASIRSASASRREEEYAGVASFGIRPMFDPPVELLEANLFDFSGDLYGRTIEVGLHHYIRPEMKFDSMEALAARMQEDAAEARRLLALPA